MDMNVFGKPMRNKISQMKHLHNTQKMLSILSLTFAALGVALMIVEIEIVAYNISSPIYEADLISFLLKTVVSALTLLLILSLIFYHRANVLLFMLANNFKSWRFVITLRWSLTILIELIICAIHVPPIPNYKNNWITYRLIIDRQEREDVPINVIVTIIMFLRGYLIFRVMVLHSHIYEEGSRRYLEIMKGNIINFEFVLKYLLTVYSKAILIVSAILVILWTSWAVRVCEIYEKNSNLNFFNNIWFIAITFMTIGYGDIVPRTVCGRFVAVLSGVFGVMYTAYVVAVIAETLQLTYSESYLHHFVLDSDLDKSIKHQAALIIQQFWKLKKAVNSNNQSNIISLELKLLQSKKNLRILKNEKNQLENTSLKISTLFYAQNQIQHEIVKLKERMNKINDLTSKIGKHLQIQSSTIVT